MKYIVLECRLSYAVVLDEDGCFRKVANRHYEVGQTVTDIIEMQIPAPAKRRVWLKPLAAMAACMVLVFSGYFFHYMPFASVYLSINPQVRIDVSRTDRVVGIEGVNDDGVTLLEGYDPRHKQLDLVMDDLVDRAIHMGYLHEGGTVTLNLDAEPTWAQSHKDTLSHHLTDHLSTGYSVTVDIGIPVTTPAPISPGETIHIPAYHESDYGESAYQAPVYPDSEDAATDYDSVSAYDPPERDDALTPYDSVSAYDPPERDDAVTAYDGVSAYDPPERDDGATGYDSASPYEPPSRDSHSDYGSDSSYDDHHESDYDDD